MQKDISLLVFDLDGTLNRTDLFSVPAHMQAIKEFGFSPKTEEEIRATFGMRAEEYMNIIAPQADWATKREYLNRISELENDFIKERGRAYDGVHDTLQKLKNIGFLTAVCSNASYRYISFVLKALHLMDLIDFIQPLEKGQTKNDTLGILLKHVKPAKAMMIGDTIYDIEAGKYNGIKTVGCLYGFRPDEAMHADYQIHSLSDLMDIMKTEFEYPFESSCALRQPQP